MTRDRLMGIGQAITMPLFFASNALYPVAVMPPWLQVIARVNPLSYEVNALRGLLIGTPTNLWLDFGVLWMAVVVGIFGGDQPCCPGWCADRPTVGRPRWFRPAAEAARPRPARSDRAATCAKPRPA